MGDSQKKRAPENNLDVRTNYEVTKRLIGKTERNILFLIFLIASAVGLPIISNTVSSVRDSSALSVTPQEFDSLIAHTRRVAVFFSSTGCAGCDEMRPLWQTFSVKYSGSMRFIEVQYGLMSSSVFDKYDVLETPTFILFVEGANISRYDGSFGSPSDMDQFLQTAYGTDHAEWSAGQPASLLVWDSPSLFISTILGISVFASPCVLPLVPGYLAILFTNGRRDARKIGIASASAFVFGAASILLIGFAFIILGDLLWSLLLAGRLLISFVLMALGLSGLVDVNILTVVPKIPSVSSDVVRATHSVPAYSFLFGLLSLSCSIPFLVGAMLNIVAGVDVNLMVIRLLTFAVGFALPLAMLTFAAGTGAKISAAKLAKTCRIASKIGGFGMIAASILLVITL